MWFWSLELHADMRQHLPLHEYVSSIRDKVHIVPSNGTVFLTAYQRI